VCKEEFADVVSLNEDKHGKCGGKLHKAEKCDNRFIVTY